MLGKGYYPYEDADSWEKFRETTIPPKEAFYNKLNLESISDADYAHVQKVWEVFEIKNFGEYHNLYAQSDTLLLADVFESFSDTCIEIYDFDSANFLTAARLAWQACLKESQVELEFRLILIYYWWLKRELEVESVRQHIGMLKQTINIWKITIKSSYLEFLDAKNLYGWVMSQKLQVNGFKWVEEEKLSKFNERFIKSYNENGDKGYFLEVDVEYPKNLSNPHKDLPFLPERQKIEKVEKLVCDTNDKEKFLST